MVGCHFSHRKKSHKVAQKVAVVLGLRGPDQPVAPRFVDEKAEAHLLRFRAHLYVKDKSMGQILAYVLKVKPRKVTALEKTLFGTGKDPARAEASRSSTLPRSRLRTRWPEPTPWPPSSTWPGTQTSAARSLKSFAGSSAKVYSSVWVMQP